MAPAGRQSENGLGCAIPSIIALVAVPILLAVVFAWEAPRAPEAPKEAVVRVIAPEGETYLIDWDSEEFIDSGRETGSKVTSGRYRDHPLPERAMPRGGVETKLISVEKATPGGESYTDSSTVGEPWEGQIYAILYVDGETVSCSSGDSDGSSYGARVGWDGTKPDYLNRKICDGYRY